MNFISPFNVPDPLTYAIPVFLTSIIIEILIITKELKHKYNYPEAIASFYMGLGVMFINLFSKTIYITLFFVIYKYRLFDFLGPDTFEGFFDLAWHKQHWYAWALLVFADDFTFYWCHRLMHEVRVLWAGHVNHHSSQEFNLAIALRQGWWEDVFKYIFWIWLPFVGFHPLMVFCMFQFSLIYQFFLHTEVIGKLGFLEKFMNTPSHHRVHHGSDLHYLDKNYGGIFIIWDRLFGSFQEEILLPKYGLTVNINTRNPFKIATHEIIALSKDVSRTRSWKDKFKYMVLGPGWTHDGEDKRAKVLQKKL